MYVRLFYVSLYIFFCMCVCVRIGVCVKEGFWYVRIGVDYVRKTILCRYMNSFYCVRMCAYFILRL